MQSTFLKLVADGLIAHAGGIEQLSKYILVFPSQRAALFLKNELKARMLEAQTERPVLLPQLITLDTLVDRFSTQAPVEEIASVVELYRIYTAHTAPEERMPLDVFYGWGRQLLTDFDNADMATSGNALSVFANSVEAHQLDNYDQLDDDTIERLKNLFGPGHTWQSEGQKRQFERLWEAMPAMYSELREKQRTEGVGTHGARLVDAVHQLEANPNLASEKLHGSVVAFVGFNYLLTAEKELLLKLRASEGITTLFFWDYRTDFHTNSTAYAYLQKNVELFGNHLPEEADAPCRQVKAIAASTSNAEAQYVHQWLLENYTPGQKTAIVIADEAMLEPVLYALPKELSGKVNITKGFPMRSTKVYADMVRFLSDKQLADQVDHGEKSLISVLEDMLAELDRKEYASKKIGRQQATERTWDYFLIMESYYQARMVVCRFCDLLAEGGLLQEVHSLKTLRSLLCQHLQMVSMPFHGEPVTDIQVIGVLETRLLDFDNMLILNVEEGVVPRTGADHSFIPYYLRKHYGMQTADEETSVYAYNFFRLLRRCPNATLVYSNSQVGESRKQMSRFLMQMLISSEWQVERHWLSEQGNTSDADSDVMAGGYRSLAEKYLTQAALAEAAAAKEEQSAAKEEGQSAAKEAGQSAAKEAGQAAEKEEGQAAEKEGQAKAHTKKKRFTLSPSAINTYLGCKRRFYFEQVRGLEVADKPEAMLRANEIGSLIHAIIQKAYEQITGCTDSTNLEPKPVSREAIMGYLQTEWQSTALEAAYKELNADYERWHGVADMYKPEEHVVENQVALRNAEKVLRHDASCQDLAIVQQELDRRTPMRIALPQELTATWQAKEASTNTTADNDNCQLSIIHYPLSSIDVWVGGKIDRLDIITEGGVRYLRILDYKTGRYDEEKMRDEMAQLFVKGSNKGYMLQTFIYSLVCSEAPDIQALVEKLGLRIMPNLLFTRMGLDSFDPHLYLLEPSDPKTTGQKKKGEGRVVNDFASLAAEFRRCLEPLVQEIVTTTDFPMCEEKDCKDYCPFRILCGKPVKD